MILFWILANLIEMFFEINVTVGQLSTSTREKPRVQNKNDFRAKLLANYINLVVKLLTLKGVSCNITSLKASWNLLRDLQCFHANYSTGKVWVATSLSRVSRWSRTCRDCVASVFEIESESISTTLATYSRPYGN